MQKYFLSVLLLFISSVLFAQNNTTSQQIDSALTVLHAQHQFNGTVLYAEKGKVLYKKAFGIADFRTSAALQTSSAFNLASVSKQFITMCIMILKEKGVLSYDDDVQKFIPEFPYQNITIRNLMTHTSGLPEYSDLFVKTRGPLETLTNEGMIKMYETLKPPLNFASGTKWEYCNTSYVLLASVIERVSKMSIEKFINKYIVLPLGLSDTYMYNINLTAPKNHVYGFEEINGKQKLNDLFFLDGVMGDGNMYASVEDLYKWEQSLYSEKLVKKATFAEGLKPVFLKDGSIYPYGFGWFIGKENEYYFHSGSWAGFYNIICRDTKNNRTLVVLSNGSNSTALKIARNIFEEKPFTLPSLQLITNVRVIDGTNTPTRKASVRIKDNIILAVGDLKPYPGESIIDGGGKILTPGFIDTHSHLDEFLKNKPDALPGLSQGITTVVGGQDGYSIPIDSILSDINAKPIAINMATYTGHATLRKAVMGDSNLHRTATNAELDVMKKNLAIEMEKGSLGLSTGLEYEDMHFSSRYEVIELAKIAALHHGRYISHMRSEDIGLTDAIDEIINVGREAKLPVQISHFKIALKSYWGTAANIIAQLESARQEGINITADCYPYEHWASTLRVLFPKTDYTNLQSAQFAIDETIDPTGSILAVFAPNKTYEGKTISEIAAIRNETDAKTLISLIAMVDDYEKHNPLAKNVEVIIGKSMNDADVQQLLSWSNTNLCSDGSDGGHPRSFGAFTRFLGKYVRDKKIISLENAVQKMTSLAAEHTGIVNRGVIAPGFYADLVLLDPATVEDKATFQNPTALSEGILKVWVNGKISYENKQVTQQYSGKFLKRGLTK